MFLTYLLIYSIVVYAISNMFVYFNGPFGVVSKFRGWISSKHETFDELFSCMFCFPTNVGIILSIISLCFIDYCPFTPFTVLFKDNILLWPLIIMFDGMYSGGIVYLLHTIQQRIENTDKNGD